MQAVPSVCSHVHNVLESAPAAVDMCPFAPVRLDSGSLLESTWMPRLQSAQAVMQEDDNDDLTTLPPLKQARHIVRQRV